MWLQLFYYCKNTLLNILNGEIMTDCYIYDTVRTPRGKGKKNGSLHEVTAVELATQVLNNIKNRILKPVIPEYCVYDQAKPNVAHANKARTNKSALIILYQG